MPFKITKLLAATAIVGSMALASPALAAGSGSGVKGSYSGYATYFGHQDFGGGSGVPFSSSIPFSVTDSLAQGSASSSVSLSATTANGNLGLHGFSQAQALAPTAQAEANFDLFAWDTFHILGATGVAQTFAYTLTLDGSVSESIGELDLGENVDWVGPVHNVAFDASCVGGYSQGNPCGGIGLIDLGVGYPAHQTISGTMQLVGGSDVVLTMEMWVNDVHAVDASLGLPDISFFDASNTGFFTLTPVTPGAGFTTDTGLTYANSPDASSAAPEPATWTMMLTGFLGLGAALRSRRQRATISA